MWLRRRRWPWGRRGSCGGLVVADVSAVGEAALTLFDTDVSVAAPALVARVAFALTITLQCVVMLMKILSSSHVALLSSPRLSPIYLELLAGKDVDLSCWKQRCLCRQLLHTVIPFLVVRWQASSA